jgi:hypothetical protein
MNSIGEFHCLQKMKEELRRIKGAILPVQLLDDAQRIAVVVQVEHPINRLVLCGLVRKHADKLVKEVKQRIQLIDTKLANKHHLNAKCGHPTTQKMREATASQRPTPPSLS